MNEEIDVSKCAFYSNGKCSNPNGMACNCRNTAICYFKELKRLELENKKLKSTIELIKEYALDMEVWSYVRKDLLNIVSEVLKDE